MQLVLTNDGLYIATDEDNGALKAISLEDLIYKFIEDQKNETNAVAICNLSEVNNWFFNYQVDLGDAIDQYKQESLLEKFKQLSNEIVASENVEGEPDYCKDSVEIMERIRIKIDNIINDHKFWSNIPPIEMGKMDS
mgnify:CR=1 FL=1|jgi:hypothetical protein|tara:strand:- start:1398 stop:1808 length:411 start_codon:yes stop_codon:yes gene_type:complete